MDLNFITIDPIQQNQDVGIYTIKYKDELYSEFEKFMLQYKDHDQYFIREDFNRIIQAIDKILRTKVYERYFRTAEGKLRDNIVAIPLDISPRDHAIGTLRLYGLRLSDELLILGNGGIKRERTYNENPILKKCVEDLSKLDFVIKLLLKKEKIKIQGTSLIVIPPQTIYL